MEKPDVRAERKPVRMRLHIVSKVGGVIPNVQSIANLRPVPHVLRERGVGRIIERHAEVALDGAKPHDNVGQRLDGHGCAARVLVRERVDSDIREFAPDFLGHIIDKRQHRAGVAAFGIVNGLTALALAGAVPVVLRHGNDRCLRRFAQPLLHTLNDEVSQVGIGQAQLRLVRGAFALDQAVPFGMLLEIFLRRHERIECVDESLVTDLAAHRRRQARSVAVVVIAGRPFAVEGRKPERLAIFKRRFLALVQIANAQIRLLGNFGGPRCPPAHAALLVQKPVHRVNRSARAATGQQQALALCADDDFFAPQFLKCNVRKIFFRRRTLPDDDGPRRNLCRRVLHFKLRTGALLQRLREFIDGVSFGFSRTCLANDDANWFAILGDGNRGLC